MNDKERVLPRLTPQNIEGIVDSPTEHSYRIQLGRLGMEDLEKVAETQRDTDWKRIEPLIKACLAIRMRLDRHGLRPHIISEALRLYQPSGVMVAAELIVPLLDALAELEKKPHHE